MAQIIKDSLYKTVFANQKYKLLSRKMIELDVPLAYSTSRKEIHKAMNNAGGVVHYGSFTRPLEADFRIWPDGSIHIGCRPFTGKDAEILKDWALSYKPWWKHVLDYLCMRTPHEEQLYS